MLAVFTGKPVAAIFCYGLELVELIFAQTFGSQIVSPQNEAKRQKQGEDDKHRLSVRGKIQVIGKQRGIGAGGRCAEDLI